MKEVTFEMIAEANKSISTTNIKGKDYAEVNQRIKAFRMVYPTGTIETEMLSNDNGICVFKAFAKDEEGKVIGIGHAYEKEGTSFINNTSYIENCETSAVGRALGMCGFGIDANVASYEEVANAVYNQAKIRIEQLQFISNLDQKLKDFALKKYHIQSLEQLTSDQAQYIIDSIKAKEAK